MYSDLFPTLNKCYRVKGIERTLITNKNENGFVVATKNNQGNIRIVINSLMNKISTPAQDHST